MTVADSPGWHGWGDIDWLDWPDCFGGAPVRTFERGLGKYAAATVLGLRVPHLPGVLGHRGPRLGEVRVRDYGTPLKVGEGLLRCGHRRPGALGSLPVRTGPERAGRWISLATHPG